MLLSDCVDRSNRHGQSIHPARDTRNKVYAASPTQVGSKWLILTTEGHEQKSIRAEHGSQLLTDAIVCRPTREIHDSEGSDLAHRRVFMSTPGEV